MATSEAGFIFLANHISIQHKGNLSMTVSPAPLTATLCLLLLAPVSHGAFPELPAFQSPPTDVRFPGKLVWADLFTEDIETSSAFYTSLFGWTEETLQSGRESYTVFRLNGKPVAGMIFRPAARTATSQGTWLPYFSVENLNRSIEATTAGGGRVEIAARDFPNRGTQAIVRDNQGALVGFMHTTHGDPEDRAADYGGWIWAQLWVETPETSIAFYSATLGFVEVPGDPDDSNVYTHRFATGGVYRASLDELPESLPDARPGWLVFIRVEDVNETLARASALGASVVLKPSPNVLNGGLAIIEDPSGAGLCLLEYEPQIKDQP